MTVVAGFERDAAGLLRVDTAAPVSSTWSGLPRTADGKLATTEDTTNATYQLGLLRSPTGRVVTVDTAAAVTPAWHDGFLRSANGALVTDAAGPFVSYIGFQRTAAGSLGITLA